MCHLQCVASGTALLSSRTCYSLCTCNVSLAMCASDMMPHIASDVWHLALRHSLRTPATLFAHPLLSSHTCHSLRTLATLLVCSRHMYVYYLTHARLEYHSSPYMYVYFISHMYTYHLTHVHVCVSCHICTSRIPLISHKYVYLISYMHV